MARHSSCAIRHFTISDHHRDPKAVSPSSEAQVIDFKLISFLSKRHFPWQIICIPSIGNFPYNLKFINYENDQHH